MEDRSNCKALWININPNTRVIISQKDRVKGFSIYLSISGHQEFVMYHRRNPVIFNMLKDGITLSELKRIVSKAKKNNSERIHIKNSISSLDHIIKVIDEFISEELGYEPSLEAI